MSAARVLVVDDHPSIRLGLQKALASKGYVVETASDGQQALEVFRSFQPHAMVLDVMMPKENGYRISRKIKMLGTLGDGVMVPKILLITARRVDGEPEREDALFAYSMADDLLYKPFKLDDVISRVRTLLGIRTPSPVSGT